MEQDFLLWIKLWRKKAFSTGGREQNFSTIAFFIFHRPNVENKSENLERENIVSLCGGFHLSPREMLYLHFSLFTFSLHSLVAGVDVGGDVADDGGGFAVVPQEILHLADGA